MKPKRAWLLGGITAVAGIVIIAGSLVGVTADESASGARPKRLPAGAIGFDYYDGHIYLDALICDSIPASLVFDTGASGLYVDSVWLAGSGLVPQKLVKGRIRGAGTDVPAVRVILDSIPFSVDTLHYQSALTPILALKEILGHRIDGIFGQKYLSESCVEINLKKGYMRAVDPDKLAKEGFVRVPVIKRDHRIFVHMRVQITPEHIMEGDFLLDMGSGGIIDIAAPAARLAGFDNFKGKKLVYNTLSGGIGGESSYVRCRAQSVTIGQYTFADIPVDVSMNESGFLAREDIFGLIGNMLLERFDFAIDFAAPALWLRPAFDFDAPFGRISPGFSMIDRTDICDGWVVTGLYEGYAPEGLRAGDTVVRWDRVPVTELDINEEQHAEGRHRIGVLRDSVEVEYICVTRELL